MVQIRHERSEDQPSIELLLDVAFGRDRHRKTSYRYRNGVAPDHRLSMVAEDHEGDLIGTIRYWPIGLRRDDDENGRALLLGPLAIRPDLHGRGIGRALVFTTLDAATALGHHLVLLVGDAEYYGRFGFETAPPHLVMPGEKPERLQYRILDGGALAAPHTTLVPWNEAAGVQPAAA
ncbi:MAG: N-acetyltransferase [Geminicoccaceae bacterium]|nr:N-acetyltransferase [Geminicoccaceae bacterium]